MLSSDDQTWVIADAMYWSVIETNIGILAASIPSYKAIAKRYAPRLLGSYGISSGKVSTFKQRRIDLRNMSRDAVGSMNKTGVDTRVENKLGATSSEEVLVAPNGRIGVKTDFVIQYDGGHEERQMDFGDCGTTQDTRRT